MKEDDPTLLKSDKTKQEFYQRIVEVNPDQLVNVIFDHLGHRLMHSSDRGNDKKTENKKDTNSRLHGIENLLKLDPIPAPNDCSEFL